MAFFGLTPPLFLHKRTCDLCTVFDVVTELAKHHAIGRVVHALWRCMPWLDVVHVLAKPAASSAQRMLCKQRVSELAPLPPTMYALLTLPLAATPCLEGNGWYRKFVLKRCHVEVPR